jgi:hypothetical protein
MILYLSIITVPGSGTQVDVNVLPTKKQVSGLYQDEAGGVERERRSLLQSTDQTFASASVQTIDGTRRRRASSASSSHRIGSFSSIKSGRTAKAAPAGALEPCLVSTKQQEQHHSGRPLFGINTTKPGAFAQQCTCPLVRLNPRSINRPKRTPPTPCTYRSIHTVRKVFTKHK